MTTSYLDNLGDPNEPAEDTRTPYEIFQDKQDELVRESHDANEAIALALAEAQHKERVEAIRAGRRADQLSAARREQESALASAGLQGNAAGAAAAMQTVDARAAARFKQGGISAQDAFLAELAKVPNTMQDSREVHVFDDDEMRGRL